jgi:hypothetical protein
MSHFPTPAESLQRTPITPEDRQRIWQYVERNPHTQHVHLTLFALLRLLAMAGCGIVGACWAGSEIADWLFAWGVWRYVLAVPGAIVVGLVGVLVGFMPFEFLEHFLVSRRIRRIKEASDEVLWRTVDRGFWNYESTIALIQLAARGREVIGTLPRLIRMLDSSECLWRRQAYGVFVLVFFDEARAIADYNPDAPYGDCREKIAGLREMMRRTSAEPSSAASEPSEAVDSQSTQTDIK